jgi:hypothetical protein
MQEDTQNCIVNIETKVTERQQYMKKLQARELIRLKLEELRREYEAQRKLLEEGLNTQL